MASKRPRISSGGGGTINDDGADGAALTKNVAPVPASTSGSLSTAASSTTDATTTAPDPLRHGTFTGRSIYRNRIGPKETVTLGHVSLQHLIPHSTQKCLCTTFISAGARWMEDTFGDRVKELLVVRHDSRTVQVTKSGGTGGQKKVGDAILEPIEVIESTADRSSSGGVSSDSDSDDDIVVSKPNWYWLRARPASGGILHAKILLFRTRGGLRVVVTGSNLCDQWVGDRDVLWMQDFDVLPKSSKKRSRSSQQSSRMYLTNQTSQCQPRFEKCLREFVMDITQCRNSGKDDAYVRKYVTDLFDGVDFSTAQSELVYSFPRERGSAVDTGRLQGGWPMLAKVVSRLKEQHENDGYNTDDDEGDVDEEETMVYVAAGCHGNLTPSFLLQMHRAMNGNTRGVRPDLSWDKAPRGLKVLWPSTRAALTLLPTGVINTGGPMSLKHWRTIPLEAKRRLLLEARSNTPVSGLAFPDLGYDPALHGKCIFATPRTASAWNPSILYVGSHNFSSAAFGDANGTADGTRPKNIELGVVLASTDRKTIAEWKERLPYVIPSSDKRPLDDGYIPMTANSGVKTEWNEAYRAGDLEGRRKAEAKLREWLQRVEVGDDEEGVKLEDSGKFWGDLKPAAATKQHRVVEEDGEEAKGENEKSRSNLPRAAAAEVVDLLMSDSE